MTKGFGKLPSGCTEESVRLGGIFLLSQGRVLGWDGRLLFDANVFRAAVEGIGASKLWNITICSDIGVKW